MVRFFAAWFLIGAIFLMTGCGSQKESATVTQTTPVVLPPDPENLADRFTAARALVDVGARDDVLARVADAAARKGDVGIVVQSLWLITDVERKDRTAFQSAVNLAKLGRHDAAFDVVKSIHDPSLRYEARREISK